MSAAQILGCEIAEKAGIVYFLTDRQAKAMEYSLVLAVSPREVSTHGTLVPTTRAAISAPPKCEALLKNTLPDSIFGKSRQSACPATP